ncbi:ABC transporter substrate-binding protein [Geminicoccus flavidas]|uniref:ABC transporter substrate-binding protein n=1 Tax=Geminicoccus flavidas TaxID=2506407 RepID=UPI0013575017|nr:PotD/PotF family extracellular solute-binding protein [Geminicoccus flavidas]
MNRIRIGRRMALAGTGALLGTAMLARPGFAQDAPDKPAELIVRAWGGVWADALDKGVSQPFTAATGIRVRHDLTEDNEIQPKIWQAAAQGRVPPIHVNWDTTVNATKSALRGVTEDLSDLPNLATAFEGARPKGLDGVPIVNTYSYVYVLAYADKAFPDGPPDSWQVMTDPRFKGRIALYDDGIGFHFPAQVAGGGKVEDIPGNMQPAWDFIAKVKENEPLLGEDPDFTTWFQNGEIDLACTIISNAREAKKNGIPVSWTVPKEGAKVDTDGLWVPVGLPENELYWARQYVNFALSRDAQQVWCDGLGLPGMVPGLTPPADLAGDPAYPTTPEDFARLISIPTRVQVENESEWFGRFKDIMQG